MNSDKVTTKEELANRQWQNVIAFATNRCAAQRIHVQHKRERVIFEVLP